MKYEVCIKPTPGRNISKISMFFVFFLEKFHAHFKLFMQILAKVHEDFEIYKGAKGPSAPAIFPSLAKVGVQVWLRVCNMY